MQARQEVLGYVLVPTFLHTRAQRSAGLSFPLVLHRAVDGSDDLDKEGAGAVAGSRTWTKGVSPGIATISGSDWFATYLLYVGSCNSGWRATISPQVVVSARPSARPKLGTQ